MLDPVQTGDAERDRTYVGRRRIFIDDAMRRALSLARRSPTGDRNPQVGCVIISSADGRIVAEGWHRGVGTQHAEVDALSHLPAEWCARTGELTAVVTLEPCNHTGHTGPCSVALIEAGIGAVAYALSDPNPVAGGGAETLRAAEVKVQGGVLAADARELLAPWLTRQAAQVAQTVQVAQTAQSTQSAQAARAAQSVQTVQAGSIRPDGSVSSARLLGSAGSNTSVSSIDPDTSNSTRPFVTIKWAQTIDGRAAAADGSSQWITGPIARADVHRRRAQADAILVGTGTLHTDDPSLTARNPEGELLVPAAEQPLPVVLGHRPIPTDARINRHPALVPLPPPDKKTDAGDDDAAPHAPGTPLQYTGEDLPSHLADLRARGIRRLFIEGGPAVASSFIRAGLVDEILIYLAPALLGGPRLALDDLGIANIAGIRRLRLTGVERLGDDLLLIATVSSTDIQSPKATAEANTAPDPSAAAATSADTGKGAATTRGANNPTSTATARQAPTPEVP